MVIKESSIKEVDSASTFYQGIWVSYVLPKEMLGKSTFDVEIFYEGFTYTACLLNSNECIHIEGASHNEYIALCDAFNWTQLPIKKMGEYEELKKTRYAFIRPESHAEDFNNKSVYVIKGSR